MMKTYVYAYYSPDGEVKAVTVKDVNKASAISMVRALHPETEHVKTLWFCFAEDEKDAVLTLRNYIAKYGTDD